VRRHAMLHRFALVLALAVTACGGRGPDMTMPPPSKEQGPLAAALASVCAAPTRAEHDPQFGDPGARNDVLNKHLSDGVTHPEVLGAIEGWRSDKKTQDQREAELAALIARAGLATPCRLADVWADPDWGASELNAPPPAPDAMTPE
jgi:hypothetical protein